MSRAIFEVVGTLDGAGGMKKGKVTIDRNTNTLYVRPHGTQQVYELPLGDVATFVCQLNLRHKAIAAREEKQAKRLSRRSA